MRRKGEDDDDRGEKTGNQRRFKNRRAENAHCSERMNSRPGLGTGGGGREACPLVKESLIVERRWRMRQKKREGENESECQYSE